MINTKDFDHETFVRICQEHAQTRELITTLLRVLAEKSEPAPRLYRLLMRLNDHLVTHFRDEEETGIFHNLWTNVPAPQRATRDLVDDHALLLDQLNHLLDRIDQTQLNRAQWVDLENRFRQFSNDLMKHEAREGELIHRAIHEDTSGR